MAIRSEQARDALVRVSNPAGRSRFVIACEHASNHVPTEFGTLGLDPDDLLRHIAWDPGALPVATRLARALDAPLVESRISRLIADANRPVDAPDLIPEISETTTIPGNAGLDAAGRLARVRLAHEPFHAALAAIIEQRLRDGLDTWLVTIHSFTPVYKGRSRPWHVGIIHDDDRRLADPMIDALGLLPDVVVGRNEPYSPADRVYYTLERHARPRELPCAMVEIRNDVIGTDEEQNLWGDRLATVLAGTAQLGLPRQIVS